MCVYLLLILFVQLVKFFLVLNADFAYHHSIVSLATILEQNAEHLPNIGQQGILMSGMGQALLYHFIKPY